MDSSCRVSGRFFGDASAHFGSAYCERNSAGVPHNKAVTSGATVPDSDCFGSPMVAGFDSQSERQITETMIRMHMPRKWQEDAASPSFVTLH